MTSFGMSRRRFVQSLTGAAALSMVAKEEVVAHPQVRPRVEDGVAWYDVVGWGVEGRGWDDTERFFDRLPSRAKGTVRPDVWALGRHSAGMVACFQTGAASIRARYRLFSPGLAMPHMPASGVSGLDLYARHEGGSWRWLGGVRPDAREMEAELAGGIPAGGGEYLLYLPLYNGIDRLEVGVPAGSEFVPIPPRRRELLVFYGTSIVQGGCASRPGMAWPAIVGRRLDLPVVNLGFSGNGRMEAEVGAFMAELESAVYVVDCLPNMTPEQVAANAGPLVRQLRGARPQTPILLVEDRSWDSAPLLPALQEQHADKRRELSQAYRDLVDDGVTDLHYVGGDGLLGDDGEATVDGSHPTDLGMMRYAQVMTPILRRILGESSRTHSAAPG